MSRKFLSFTQNSIGVDVGNKQLRFLSLSKKANKIYFNEIGVLSLNEIDSQKRSPFKKFNKAHLAIAMSNVLRKSIPFDLALSRKDIKSELMLNQKKYFSGIQDELVFNFFIKKQEEDQVVRVYAVRKGEVERCSVLLKTLNGSVMTIEPDSYALLRSLFFALPEQSFSNHSILLTKTQEKLKILFFNQETILFEQTATGIDALPWLQQIWHTFNVNFINCHLECLYLFPYSVSLNDDELQSIFNLPIKRVAPFEKVEKIEQKEFDPAEFILPFGLALRGFYG